MRLEFRRVLFRSGVFEGVGIGLCYRSRSSSGGTELLARLVLRYVKDITLGKIIRILSLVIVGTSLIVTNGFSVIYYTLIELYVATKVSDFVNESTTPGVTPNLTPLSLHDALPICLSVAIFNYYPELPVHPHILHCISLLSEEILQKSPFLSFFQCLT